MSTSRQARRKKRWQRENHEVHQRAARRWRENNREYAIAATAAWNAAHPDARREHLRRFRERHPGYDREIRARRKLRNALMKFAAACAAGRVQLQGATCES